MKNATATATKTAKSTATKAKTVKSVKVAKSVMIDQPIEQVQISKADQLLNALNNRLTALSNLDATACASQTKQLKPLINRFALGQNAVNRAMNKMHETDFDRMFSIIENMNKNVLSNYIQVKSLIKLVDMLEHIGINTKATNNNTNIVVNVILKNSGKASISELIVAQCVKAKTTRTTRTDLVTDRNSYSIGTATSQSGQVRDVLRVCNLAQIVKNKTEDIAVISDYGNALLLPIYGELISEE